jgi:hypothetical protein
MENASQHVEHTVHFRLPVSQILAHMDHDWRYLLTVRSLTPYLVEHSETATGYRSAPFYRARGYGATVRFDRLLGHDEIDQINLAGHWVNQSYVIRTYAYLQYCRVFEGKLNHLVEGWYDLDLLRRLRNYFAHTPGRYDPANECMKRTYDALIEKYRLSPESYPERGGLFPIPVDEVLCPMVEGCRAYVSVFGQKCGCGM